MIVQLIVDKEFKDLIPPLSDEEYKGLEENIVKEGCRDSIVTWEGVIVDGHNRYEICTRHNIPFNTVERNFNSRQDAIEWIILNQFSRRNLPAYERAILALRLKPVIAEKAKINNKIGADITNTGLQNSVKAINTQSEIAKIAGVSHDTIAKVERIEKVIAEDKPIAGKKPEELRKELMKGDMSINQVYSKIKQEERKELIQKQVEEIEKGNIEKPTGLFDVIAMDPPWNYGTTYSAEGRRVANPYPEMAQDQLKAMDVPAKENCVMFLWTTHKFIWDAKELLDTWGFTYRAMLVWDKEKIGMGDLVRMQCEFCLIGIKGKPVFKDEHGIRDIIREPRREHSRKPDAFYQLVDSLCVGNKLDYFSREQREGWSSYGNDTEKF